MQPSQPQASSLARTVGYFAHALSAIGTLLLVPVIERVLRPLVFGYFLPSFPGELAAAASWAFVALVTLAVFFGTSSLFQVLIQLLVRRSARYSGF